MILGWFLIIPLFSKTIIEKLNERPNDTNNILANLINFKLLSSSEKNYLFKYHLDVYSNISKYLNLKEKKWLTTFI